MIFVQLSCIFAQDESRMMNKDCMFLAFTTHDMWHVVSAVTLVFQVWWGLGGTLKRVGWYVDGGWVVLWRWWCGTLNMAMWYFEEGKSINTAECFRFDVHDNVFINGLTSSLNRLYCDNMVLLINIAYLKYIFRLFLVFINMSIFTSVTDLWFAL